MGTSNQPKEQVLNYRVTGKTIAAFHASDAFVRGIMGPYGSGQIHRVRSIEILRRASEQHQGVDGLRRTRWAIIRNSYPELKSTTIKTWGQWVPPQYGRMTFDAPITHHVKVGDLDMEVLFLALDNPEDVKKLGSLELTGAWVNEAREIPKAIIDALTGRVGRYPSRLQGGCKWSGILLDTNPPDDQSWWYRLDREDRPKGFEFFQQPPGDSPEAENLENLPPEYYERQKAGKEEEWINVYVRGLYGFLIEGKPVYPMYRDRVHASDVRIEAIPGLPILVGADFGLTPAAIFGQKLVDGRWVILDEFTTDSCGVIRFAELIVKFAAEKYPDHALLLPDFMRAGRGLDDAIAGFGDPAGQQRAQTDEQTALDLMKEHTGWSWKPAPSNVFTLRREVVVAALNRLVDGKPGIILNPNCRILRKGFASMYHYKFVRSGDGTRVHEEPAKNEFSHPHDALQYMMLGGGEHHVVMNRTRRASRSRGPQIAGGVGDEHKFFT
jgi:hypothetical protein